MNRIIGIILVVVGIISGVYALSTHEKEKTLIEIGDLEIKKSDQRAGKNTQMYYIIAAIGIIGGGIMLTAKNNQK